MNQLFSPPPDAPGSLPAELLLDYASGAAPEPVALAVATCLDLNPEMRSAYRALNEVGGIAIENAPVAAMAGSTLASLLARLDQEPQEKPLTAPQLNSLVPVPLQPYIGSSWENLQWKTLVSGVEEYVLETGHRHGKGGWRTSLLRIRPGRAMPHHTHAGEEYTVVLDGSYDDEAGHFGRGAIEIADGDIRHRPIADEKTGCVCLAVLSAPVQLTGVIGWFVNPFLRH